MSRIKKEGAVAHLIKGEIVCCGCLKKGEKTPKHSIRKDEVSDNDVLTCERCNKVIIG